ncbi:hypothetical protein PHYBLDRAFT_63875 [Phycomyces blakesleeanus NRRL 1555(-)]|uniref:Uncharacterized protein n=1 Tax=Phycomyces blakesleeanus (strain ATCC 8743b / DSM 1359 / FGSC 10004 / NBRC 33097 / NRRL 1555) TaxID=763407 RepID=A0A162PUP6_PHYB8|nr:hypothetical protein PHYBLDRAFT_63875 [Phycomyces blakesleeanus NRRL 1555(-)]OAD74176.1 hypothetical protein PHYBLDRAFT_63875 [Phycomyces blakesleeanus NRRL 1555(-)]|eukprot:XP_018292216.1 hypothetical protein PHYBLDRAFT_63875 [Phycomyces blakesleeanus NRRL 1555(-)]
MRIKPRILPNLNEKFYFSNAKNRVIKMLGMNTKFRQPKTKKKSNRLTYQITSRWNKKRHLLFLLVQSKNTIYNKDIDMFLIKSGWAVIQIGEQRLQLSFSIEVSHGVLLALSCNE